MSNLNSDIYKWKRWSRKPVSATHTAIPDGRDHDIEHWIKKVEAASDQAAAITFGRNQTRKYPITDGHDNAMATIAALQDGNEAQDEARDLLNQWMVEKLKIDDSELRFDDDEEDEFSFKTDRSNTKKGDLERILDIDFSQSSIFDPYEGVKSEDIFNEIDSRDENQTVQGILEGMLNQEFVDKKSFKQNLGLQRKHKDPKTTMQARQNQVKANRLKRQQEKEEKQKSIASKKEAQFQAKQILLREEKEKKMKSKKEEKLIQQDMARIRKQMLEQRCLEEESKISQKHLEEEVRLKEKLEEENQLAVREEAIRQIKEEEENNRRKLEEERREMQRKVHDLRVNKQKEKLKILQQHFSAWYKLTQNNRIKIGKARAVADWRCMLRAWNAWRAYVQAVVAEREMKETELHIREAHRLKTLAEKHSRRHTLRKHFIAWYSVTQAELRTNALYKDKDVTRNKMALFLEAAASGKLWTNRENEELVEEAKTHSSKKSASNGKHIEDLFAEPGKTKIASAPSTARSEVNDVRPNNAGDNNRKAKVERPKHAWQVTRRHTKLTKEELLDFQLDDDSECNNQNERASPRPKQVIKYTVNNIEHRYAAQQKILAEQQSQLKEQHRMIEELQAQQRGNALKRELEVVQGQQEVVTHPVPEFHIPVTDRSDATSTARSDETVNSQGSQKNSNRNNAPLLKGMEERAKQRAIRKAEIEERRRKKEEQQLAKQREQEKIRLAEEEAEKKARIEKRKEEKRLLQQKEIEKQARLNEIAEKNALASEHYRQTLMRNKGLLPWMKLVQIAQDNYRKAVCHHNDRLLRECLLAWHQHTQNVLLDKKECADELYSIILVKRYFSSWKRYGHYQSIQLQKARRHYKQTLKIKIFTAWADHVEQEKFSMIDKEKIAEEFDHIRGLKTVFNAWRRFPKLLKTERDREKRVSEMRKKVASLLPDFGSS